MIAAPMTLTKPMIAPCERSIPPTMMTKVWPTHTASSGQTLDSWFEMLRGSARLGKNEREDDEVGDAQVQDEVVGQQDAPQEPGDAPGPGLRRGGSVGARR